MSDFNDLLHEGILDLIKFKQSSAGKGIIDSANDIHHVLRYGNTRQKVNALRSPHVNDEHIYNALNDKDMTVRNVAANISRIKMNYVLKHKHLNESFSRLFDDEFTDEQLKNHKKLIKPVKLSDRDKNELGNFTTTSNTINVTHWVKKLGTHPDIDNREENYDEEHDLKRTHRINDILDKLPTSDKDLTVYSGVSSRGNIPDVIKNGGILHVPAFMSTSLSPRIASQFSVVGRKTGHGTIMAINIPKGSHEGGYISPYSVLTDEREFLLKNNKLLKFDKPHEVVKKDVRGYGATDYHIYHAHIMTNEEIEANKDHPEVQRYLNYKH